MSKRETSSEIDDAAALWAIRIDEATLDNELQAEFDTWLEGDIRRLGAYVRAQAVLANARRAKALGTEFEPASFDRDPASIEANEDEPPELTGLTRRGMVFGASGVAASAALAFVLLTDRASARVYETRRGESRLVPLEDGSTVTLNTDSRIAVTIDRGRRTVQLIRGEALFKVATGRRALFTVEAGDAAFRADGAIFCVARLDAKPLRVQVCDGNVEVARAAGTDRLLHANTQAIIPPSGAVVEQRVTPQALQRDLAWQQGMLSFEDTPLSQAAEAFARYSNRRIRFAEAALGSETVTGLYAANDPEGFARAVALSLDLHMQSSPGGILLTR